MNLLILNRICFTICLVCIVVGVVLGITMIWVSWNNEILWKGFLTIAVLFAGSALTLSVNKTLGGRIVEGP